MAAGVCVLMALAVSRVLRSMLVGPGAPPPEHQLESANRWLSCSFALQKTVILGARNPGVAAGSSGGAGGGVWDDADDASGDERGGLQPLSPSMRRRNL